jgi:hypothetical protein
VVRGLEKDLYQCPLDSANGWRVIIVDECHCMTAKAVSAWLTLLERLSARRLVIFTTTRDTDSSLFGDTPPDELKAFLGRVTVFRLTNQGLVKAFAPFLHRVAGRERLNGQPIAAYETLLKECGNSVRKALDLIQQGKMVTA